MATNGGLGKKDESETNMGADYVVSFRFANTGESCSVFFPFMRLFGFGE